MPPPVHIILSYFRTSLPHVKNPRHPLWFSIPCMPYVMPFVFHSTSLHSARREREKHSLLMNGEFLLRHDGDRGRRIRQGEVLGRWCCMRWLGTSTHTLAHHLTNGTYDSDSPQSSTVFRVLLPPWRPQKSIIQEIEVSNSRFWNWGRRAQIIYWMKKGMNLIWFCNDSNIAGLADVQHNMKQSRSFKGAKKHNFSKPGVVVPLYW